MKKPNFKRGIGKKARLSEESYQMKKKYFFGGLEAVGAVIFMILGIFLLSLNTTGNVISEGETVGPFYSGAVLVIMGMIIFGVLLLRNHYSSKQKKISRKKKSL